ncbi:MAG: hypothetical protein OCD76_01620 [Reichenbachiella sp.]
MANINVLMAVDTIHITNNNMDTSIYLMDDNGDSDDTPGDPTTFDIVANSGDTVSFTIVPLDGTTKIAFKKFELENGSDIFDPLPSLGNLWVGTVNGAKGSSENFSIKFTVEGKGRFTLDPKIGVRV